MRQYQEHCLAVLVGLVFLCLPCICWVNQPVGLQNANFHAGRWSFRRRHAAEIANDASGGEMKEGQTFESEYTRGTTFREEYGDMLPEWLISRLEELGYMRPTLVQRRALDVVMKGSDAVIHAQTGSGKTLSFLIPIFASINPSKTAVQAIIVVPTRELGMQVASVAKRLAAATGGASGLRRVHVMSLLEGSQNKRQRAWATAAPPQVVIGNPGALAALVRGGGLRYRTVRLVVVDEVDACLLAPASRGALGDLLAKDLSPTFLTPEEAEEVEAGRLEAARVRPRQRQTIFASATVPQHNHFIRQCFQRKWTGMEPAHVYVTPQEFIPECLRHYYQVVPKEKRLSALRRLVVQEYGAGRLGAGIVFASETWPLEQMTAVIGQDLKKNGFQAVANAIPERQEEDRHAWKRQARGGKVWNPGPAESLAPGHPLQRRADVLDAFRDGRCRILVAPDIAARGLDIPETTTIFNFELPKDAETYVHRAGRAGRMGRPGQVVSLILPEQAFVMQRMANQLGIEVQEWGGGSSFGRHHQQQCKEGEEDEEEGKTDR
mmetsp:Transcript_29487/g.46487  ORF Transcript_29487/g.46487 Transcript_29487/m.46487 type:complete len:549 (+) Transcript_29487:79-1725(+)